MADKSKKNVYRKTMGFNHKDTNTYTEYVKNSFKGAGAEIDNAIQQAGLGHKKPHVKISNANMGTYQRPTPSYDKDKFKGAKDGYNKTFLSARGNKSKNDFDSYAVTRARRKLVKGT
tara:strand:- start:92 stop:442 length:351 start_codon:yes stop_codon:yes gene_type:complete